MVRGVPGGMLLQQGPLSGIKLPPKSVAEGCFSNPQKSKRLLCFPSAQRNQPCLQCYRRNNNKTVTDNKEATKLS